MKKQIEITLPDLFHLQQTLRETILAQIKKDKRTTQTITAQKCKCSLYAAKTNLEKLTESGLVKDLGFHMVNSRKTKVYEIA